LREKEVSFLNCANEESKANQNTNEERKESSGERIRFVQKDKKESKKKKGRLAARGMRARGKGRERSNTHIHTPPEESDL